MKDSSKVTANGNGGKRRGPQQHQRQQIILLMLAVLAGMFLLVDRRTISPYKSTIKEGIDFTQRAAVLSNETDQSGVGGVLASAASHAADLADAVLDALGLDDDDDDKAAANNTDSDFLSEMMSSMTETATAMAAQAASAADAVLDALGLDDDNSDDKGERMSNSQGSKANLSPNATDDNDNSGPKYFVLDLPEITERLLDGDNRQKAFDFYMKALNEDRGERWLHLGMLNRTWTQGRTLNASEADYFLIPGYLHFAKHSKQTKSREEVVKLVMENVVNKTKPHILLIPSTNPTLASQIGVKGLAKGLLQNGVNTYSLGYERNSFWQEVQPPRIIPIPYVLGPKANLDQMTAFMQHNRTKNFVFYIGDRRRMAVPWSGCDRAMVNPLEGRDNMLVRLVGKGTNKKGIPQDQYNHRMQTSDYCLVLCGDTVTSRSLVSAFTAGCIPIIIGSRLRGLCEPPCKKGWGWTITNGYPHLPFVDQINWTSFPEVNESQFVKDPYQTLQTQVFDVQTEDHKVYLRSEMQRMMPGMVYGWGNPVEPYRLGDVYSSIWKTIQYHIPLKKKYS